MSALAIQAQGLSKEYVLGELGPRGTFREALGAWRRGGRASAVDGPKNAGQPQRIWAIDDISFELRRGEALGIIGRNGAGKSTLLKILSRITEPTRGRAEIHGRVGSLLEVGTGFHPDLTGRENVFMNGAILGMTEREVRAKFDEIVEFAGIGKFIDTPAKRYSSGMYTRLAFAVAAHLEPDILIVDEVLAVGDLDFQRKCLGRMSTVAGHGRTVIFVSHHMAAVSSLCRQSMVLDQGRMTFIGSTDHAIRSYVANVSQMARTSLAERTDRTGEGRLRLVSFDILGADGRPSEIVLSGQPATFRICAEKRLSEQIQGVTFGIGIYTTTGQFLSLLTSDLTGDVLNVTSESAEVRCKVERVPLIAGMYSLSLVIRRHGVIEDWIEHAALVAVENGDFFGTGRSPPTLPGGVLMAHTWTMV